MIIIIIIIIIIMIIIIIIIITYFFLLQKMSRTIKVLKQRDFCGQSDCRVVVGNWR